MSTEISSPELLELELLELELEELLELLELELDELLDEDELDDELLEPGVSLSLLFSPPQPAKRVIAHRSWVTLAIRFTLTSICMFHSAPLGNCPHIV